MLGTKTEKVMEISEAKGSGLKKNSKTDKRQKPEEVATLTKQTRNGPSEGSNKVDFIRF